MVEYDTRSDDEFDVVDIARHECWEYVQPEVVKTLGDGRILLIINEDAAYDDYGHAAWQGENLRRFPENGYIPTSVSDTHLWLKPVGMELPEPNR